jgi:hypothetical protein
MVRARARSKPNIGFTPRGSELPWPPIPAFVCTPRTPRRACPPRCGSGAFPRPRTSLANRRKRRVRSPRPPVHRPHMASVVRALSAHVGGRLPIALAAFHDIVQKLRLTDPVAPRRRASKSSGGAGGGGPSAQMTLIFPLASILLVKRKVRPSSRRARSARLSRLGRVMPVSPFRRGARSWFCPREEAGQPRGRPSGDSALRAPKARQGGMGG